METRRLFIGGLYSDIKEADLRDRFKTFGTVSSVEIIRRTDDKGYPMKTFAYLDITQKESDYKRCVSLLSNSKWKGCCLKVQAAKESFLTRLQREREQRNLSNTTSPSEKGTKTDLTESSSKEETQKQHSIPQAIPKAVPGTPLPGKKNWVVGKFGRVLPVVYLRRRDRKKIAKFDPSKTTHCLKRINLEEPITTVSELTWNLGSEREIANGTSLKVKKQQSSKLKDGGNKQTDFGTAPLLAQISTPILGSTMQASVNAGAFQENTAKKPGKKSSERIPRTNRETFPIANPSASDGSDFESDSNDSYSESDSSHQSYTELNKSSSNRTETASAELSDRLASASRNAIQTASLLKNIIQRRKTDIPSNLNEEKRFSGSKMQNSRNNSHDALHSNCALQDGDDEDVSGESSSSDSGDETSDSDSSEGETVLTENRGHFSSEGEEKIRVRSSDDGTDESIQSLRIHAEERPLRSPKTKGQPNMTGDSPKKKLSNDKRLDALEEKKKSALAQKNAIKDALKDLDSGAVQSCDGKKHIVFGDDGDDANGSEVMEKRAYAVGEKISGSKASSWLGLDSDSDEDSDDSMGDGGDEERDHLVTFKPQFEGKAGEELFKLQRTFGGDKRFDLHSRFLESEEDDDNDDDNHMHKETAAADAKSSVKEDEEDDICGNLKQEKEMAMKVLSDIMGGDFRADFGLRESGEKVPEFRSSAAVHYDPTREDHKQFEQATDSEKRDKQTREPAFVKEMRPEDPVLPEVSKDKYYDTNASSLAELFGSKKQGTSSFTFLSQESEDDIDSTAVEGRLVGSAEDIKKNPWQATAGLPYDSSDDNDDGDDDNTVVEDADGDAPSKSTSQLDDLFFFHPDDPELENRINDKEVPFMRTGSQEDVSEYWVSVRSELTQDYKRKRKDAVRRQNKLAAKRSRHR